MKNEGYQPKTFDSIDSVPEVPQAPAAPEAAANAANDNSVEAPEQKIETYANGNPVQPERVRETIGDRGERLLGVAMEKVGTLGNKTGELLGNVAERGGAAFASLKGFAEELKQRWNTGAENVPQMLLNTPEGIKETEKTLEASTAEATTDTATAKAGVETLTSNYTPEGAANARAAITSAAEKNMRVGSENFSLMKWATQGISKYFRMNILKLQIEVMDSTTEWTGLWKRAAERRLAKAQANEGLFSRGHENALQIRANLWNKLRAIESGKPIPEAVAAIPTVEQPAAEAAKVETPIAEAPAAEEAPVKMPELRDEGIEAAFAQGAGKTPELRDEGIEEAFAWGSRGAASSNEAPAVANDNTVEQAPAAPNITAEAA